MNYLAIEFGVRIGYDLGRLKFLTEDNNSHVVFNKRREIIQDLTSMLSIDEINCAYNDSFDNFASEILAIYCCKDMEKFYGILLGISFVEIVVSHTQSQEIADRFIKVVKNRINLIPDNILSTIQKNNFISRILQIEELNFMQLSNLLDDVLFNTSKHSVSDSKYVFISYSSHDISKAKTICSTLEDAGINTWMAPNSIPAGADYGECIPSAIANCVAFVLILSEKSQNSKWVPKELDVAIDSDRIIIPFHIDNSELKKSFNFRLTNVQRIEASNNINEAFSSLVRIIQEILKI